MAEETHLVRPHTRRSEVKGYRRRKPYTYDHPTQAQRQARDILANIAVTRGRGKTGTVDIIGKRGEVKEVPASAVPIREEMGGMVIAPLPEPLAPPLPPIERLRRALAILAASTARLETL